MQIYNANTAISTIRMRFKDASSCKNFVTHHFLFKGCRETNNITDRCGVVKVDDLGITITSDLDKKMDKFMSINGPSPLADMSDMFKAISYDRVTQYFIKMAPSEQAFETNEYTAVQIITKFEYDPDSVLDVASIPMYHHLFAYMSDHIKRYGMFEMSEAVMFYDRKGEPHHTLNIISKLDKHYTCISSNDIYPSEILPPLTPEGAALVEQDTYKRFEDLEAGVRKIQEEENDPTNVERIPDADRS